MVYFSLMQPLTAIFLGCVQGITEFLPISSSGHLALLEHYLKVEGGGLSFDILLHVGSLLALLVYFRADWLGMAKAVLIRKRLTSRSLIGMKTHLVLTIPL